MRPIFALLMLCALLSGADPTPVPSKHSLLEYWQKYQENVVGVDAIEATDKERVWRIEHSNIDFSGLVRILDIYIEPLPDEPAYSGAITLELVNPDESVSKRPSFNNWFHDNYFIYTSDQEWVPAIEYDFAEYDSLSINSLLWEYWWVVILLILVVPHVLARAQFKKAESQVQESLRQTESSQEQLAESIEQGKEALRQSEEANQILREMLNEIRILNQRH